MRAKTKLLGEDLQALPPISKLQVKSEIQNVLFKYRIAAIQYSLQKMLNSAVMVDDNFSPSKTGKTQLSNNFGNHFQANFSPNSSTNSSGWSHHWTHRMNMNNYDFS